MKQTTENPVDKSKSLSKYKYGIINKILSNRENIYTILKYIFYLIFGFGIFSKLISRFVLPKIAQNILDLAKLNIKSILVSECQSDSLVMYVNIIMDEVGPFPATITFDQPIRMGFMMEDKEIYFAQAKMPNLKIRPNHINQVGIKLNIDIMDHHGMGCFARQVLNGNNSNILLKGRCKVYAFGFIPINDLVLNKMVEVKGMNGLKDLKVDKVTVLNGDDKQIYLGVLCNIFNPSSFEIDMGNTKFNLYYKDNLVGHVLIKDMHLNCESNQFSSFAYFHPEEECKSIAAELLSRFTSGLESEVTIKGDHPDAHELNYWKYAMMKLNIITTMNGVNDKLIRCARLQLSPKSLISGMLSFSAPSKLELFNPFECGITINRMQAKVFMEDKEIGTMMKDLYHQPLYLLKNKITITDQLDLKLILDTANFKTLSNSLINNHLKFDVEATINANLGNYPVVISYQQQQVNIDFGL